MNGIKEIINLLLDHGADTAVKDDEGNTPLLNAIYEHDSVTALHLIEKGADAITPGVGLETPYQAAARLVAEGTASFSNVVDKLEELGISE